MPEKKPHLNLIVIGHIDHGKSTLGGQLLVKKGAVDKRTLETYKTEAEKIGKGSEYIAWVMDRLKEERERGVTIDIMFQRFETDKYYFTFIDAPGHRDFVKNMITGASQADAAMLVISAKKGEFEAGIGPGGQTREHAYLAFTLGVSQMIVSINKMDDQTVNWSKDRYEEVKKEVSELLKVVGYKIDKVPLIPTSAWLGENLIEPSSKMPWYKGPTIIQALDSLTVPPKPIDKPLRIPIQDVYSISGAGTVPVGRVETGVLKAGDTVMFMPGSTKGEVKSIEMHHERLDQAVPGDNIGFNVRGIDRADIRRGHVAGSVNNPPTVVKEFTGQIVIIQHPTSIASGYTPVLHTHTASVACKFDKLLSKIDPRTGQVIQENPDFIKAKDNAVVKLVPSRPLVIEKYSDIPQLGRFAIRDMGITIAVGIVKDVVKAEKA
nr:translation elongation factor EF-1 subunit alpha [Candidatus Njordarchaeum guaymaensis]